MAVTLPSAGQDPWDATLNTALTDLDNAVTAAAGVAAGKETAGAAASAVAAHEAAPDPHPGYATEAAVASALAGKSDTGHGHAYDPAGSAAAAQAAAIAASQPLDSDLTAIAALTTTSYGRAFLALADAAAARSALGLGTAATSAAGDFQPVDSDLTAIAALTTTAYGRSLLALADAAAGRTALGLGTAAVLSTADVDERARDALGSALVAGSGITITPNDGADTITIAASGGSSAGVLLSGPGAPSGGSDGDWYIRTGSPASLYKKVSGAWEAWGRVSSLFAQNPTLRSSPWTASYAGAYINTSTATAAQLFPNNASGLTKTGASCVLSNSLAAGTVVGGYGAAMTATLTALPGAAQVAKFGLGGYFYGSLYPYVSVNNSGVAVLTNGSTTLKTFSGTVSGSTNNGFVFDLLPGALLVCQTTPSGVIVDQALYASEYIQIGLGTNIGWIMKGYGTVAFNALEVYG